MYGEVGDSLGGRGILTLRFLEERLSCRVISRAMEEFSEVDNHLLMICL